MRVRKKSDFSRTSGKEGRRGAEIEAALQVITVKAKGESKHSGDVTLLFTEFLPSSLKASMPCSPLKGQCFWLNSQ
jgi:hypothetical protein